MLLLYNVLYISIMFLKRNSKVSSRLTFFVILKLTWLASVTKVVIPCKTLTLIATAQLNVAYVVDPQISLIRQLYPKLVAAYFTYTANIQNCFLKSKCFAIYFINFFLIKLFYPNPLIIYLFCRFYNPYTIYIHT